MPRSGEAGMFQADAPTNLESIQGRLAELSTADQWAVTYYLLHERFGDDPQQGAALTDADGKTYLFLVPPHLLENADAEGVHEQDRSVSQERFLDIINGTGDPETIARRLWELAETAS